MPTCLQIHSLEYYEVIENPGEFFIATESCLCKILTQENLPFCQTCETKSCGISQLVDFLYLTRMFRVTGRTKCIAPTLFVSFFLVILFFIFLGYAEILAGGNTHFLRLWVLGLLPRLLWLRLRPGVRGPQ